MDVLSYVLIVGALVVGGIVGVAAGRVISYWLGFRYDE